MILYPAGFFILVIFYRIECIENDARIAKDRTKTQNSIRTLQLVNSVKEILIKMKETEKLNKLKFGAEYKNEYEGYVYKDDMDVEHWEE